jgi:hypothetical protein
MGVKCIRKHVGSLLGLKEYYRQARKLKRTIKVILGLRNFTNGNKRVFMDDEIEEKASDVTVENNQANNERVTQNSLTQSVPVK